MRCVSSLRLSSSISALSRNPFVIPVTSKWVSLGSTHSNDSCRGYCVSGLPLNLHFAFFTLQFPPALSCPSNKMPFPR